jgi:N-acetylneuraminate synthase
MSEIRIGGRPVGDGHPAYLVAELSANHGGELAQAEAVVRAAKEAGADAIKLQTYTPSTLTIDCDAAPFQIGAGSPWAGRRLYELYGEAYTPWEWHEPLQTLALELGLDFFSTPFDATAVELLERMRVPAFKIASFEVVDLELIRHVARTGKPIIMSTGMATLAEIEEAVTVARGAGATEVVLLKCTSAYPSPPEEMHLRTIPHLRQEFDVPVGLSDHTLGITVAVAAVALGATMIEKHLTLARSLGGPDSAFSLEPAEFKAMVDAVRTVEAALGDVQYGTGRAEEKSRVFRRSLFVVEDVRSGEVFTDRNVRSIRPGYGLAPRHLPEVLGRRATADLKRGTPVEWSHIGERAP